jgi:polar amino acid transport system substrate-binding protein
VSLFAVGLLVVLWVTPTRAQNAAELRWGGDAEGGAPFVEADPNEPSRVVGFEVEVATLIANGLGRVPRFVQSGFTTLSGIEDSPARRSRLAVTVPYHQFREVLTVREADATRFRTLADLRGRRVATLGATLAFDLLTRAQAEHGLIPVTYEDDVHPYSDLALGRVDAVLLDHVLAERRVRQNPGLTNQPTDAGVGYYFVTASTRSSGRRCGMAASKLFSAAGRCGTTTNVVSMSGWSAEKPGRRRPNRRRLRRASGKPSGDTCRRCSVRQRSHSACRVCR